MADVLTGSTETIAVANAKVANLVQSYLIQESKLLPLVTNYTSLVGPGIKSLSLPKSGGFTVGDKVENTPLGAQSVTYSTDTISLTVHKAIQFLIEKFASRQAAPAVTSDMLMKAGKDMALAIDTLIAAELKKASVGNTIDFNDGVNNDVELEDVLNTRALLQAQNINIEECYMGVHPAKEKDMLRLENFIDASKWGNAAPIQNGVIGKVYGLKIVVSNVFDNDSIVAWHPSSTGFAFAQGIVVDTQPDLAQLATRYSLDMICGTLGGLDSGKRQVLVAPVA